MHTDGSITAAEYARESSIFSGLEDSTAPDEEWAGDSETEEDSVF